MTQSLGLERLRVSHRRSSESIPVSIIKYAFCSIHVFSETGKIGLYFLYAVTYLLYIYRECSTLERLCGSYDLHIPWYTHAVNEWTIRMWSTWRNFALYHTSCFSVFVGVHNFLSLERRIASLIAFDLTNLLIVHPKSTIASNRIPTTLPFSFPPLPTKDRRIFFHFTVRFPDNNIMNWCHF